MPAETLATLYWLLHVCRVVLQGEAMRQVTSDCLRWAQDGIGEEFSGAREVDKINHGFGLLYRAGPGNAGWVNRDRR